MIALIVDTNWGAPVSAAVWATTAFFIWRGALLGSRGHMRPRLWLAWFVSLWAVWFTLGTFGVISNEAMADLVRVTSWAVAASLTATAWTGVKYGRKVEAVVDMLERGRDANDHGGSQ